MQVITPRLFCLGKHVYTKNVQKLNFTEKSGFREVEAGGNKGKGERGERERKRRRRKRERNNACSSAESLENNIGAGKK